MYNLKWYLSVSFWVDELNYYIIIYTKLIHFKECTILYSGPIDTNVDLKSTGYYTKAVNIQI